MSLLVVAAIADVVAVPWLLFLGCFQSDSIAIVAVVVSGGFIGCIKHDMPSQAKPKSQSPSKSTSESALLAFVSLPFVYYLLLWS